MNIQIRAKDITLNPTTKTHLELAIDAFTKYQLDITTVNVTLSTQKKGVEVEFDIHIAHAQPVIITQSDDNSLEAAIDIAIDRTTKALRRLHDKIISHKNSSIKDIETLDA